MRCPYCGGLNQDTDTFCRHCGRDTRSPLRAPGNKQPVPQPPRPTRSVPPPPQRSAYPVSKPPYPVTPVQAPPALQNTPGAPVSSRRAVAVPSIPVVPVEPEPPAPFPPHTVEQLRALEQGALDYTLVSDDEDIGHKRIVRVAYPRCTGWQQLATLYKVLGEYKEDKGRKFDTVIVQGMTDADASAYSFNNGQFVFDRNVRLGSESLNRYQIETGNGFAGDAIRIVLTEAVK